MIETPHITQTTEQTTALIHFTVPREQISSVMGPGVAEVMAAISAQGIAPTGPWFTHHFRRPTDTFDFEICVPVSQPIAPDGRVVPGTWPAMKVARTIFQGNYSGLPAAWGEFQAWIADNGHKTAIDLWERYLINPDSTPNPADWRTELNRPLID
jgi:effector-binding domain-containing protein